MEYFSETLKSETYVKPEKLLVLRHKERDYPSYYNEHTNKWGGLLDATIYTGNEVPDVPESELVDYREITGIK